MSIVLPAAVSVISRINNMRPKTKNQTEESVDSVAAIVKGESTLSHYTKLNEVIVEIKFELSCYCKLR